MDLARRDEYEQDLARALGRTLRQQYNKFFEVFGDKPSLNQLTAQLFNDFRDAMQAAIRPTLEDVFLAHSISLMNTPVHRRRTKQGGIGMDFGVVNERAANWASQHSFDLVTDVTDTQKKILQKQIGDFYTDQRTMGDLKKALTPAFGPVRAEMIAQTEVTRAASAAEMAYAEEMRAMGLEVIIVWQTNNDEIVARCPVCFPLHDTEQGDGWDDPPPAHPRCRCWINSEVM